MEVHNDISKLACGYIGVILRLAVGVYTVTITGFMLGLLNTRLYRGYMGYTCGLYIYTYI